MDEQWIYKFKGWDGGIALDSEDSLPAGASGVYLHMDAADYEAQVWIKADRLDEVIKALEVVRAKLRPIRKE